ncbi:MAG: glycosyltransferase family 2 protein [Deltaproteobacteria bacterium]|nr:glycosyltransferase family 2 protein [Deltaproteobacteria bacterium]
MRSEFPPDISVIIPCRNEERYIGETIDRVAAQTGAGERFTLEMLIVDGKSDDRTQSVVREQMGSRPALRLIVNEKQITPVAFNLGIREARGRYICILGAHAEIAPDYLQSCLSVIQQVDADNVGGPWRAQGYGRVGEAIAVAFQAPFAVGGAKGHDPDYEGYLDTVWGGFYKREVFERIGLFDEELVRNQDDELNYRLVKAGGKIWQSPRILFFYVCRDSLRQLFLQYYQYGYWKVRVIRKHRLPASIRHLVPGGFVGALLVLLVLAPFNAGAGVLFAALLVLYAAANLAASCAASLRARQLRLLPVLPAVFAAFHFGYGWGFLRGFVDFVLLRRQGRRQFSQVTR